MYNTWSNWIIPLSYRLQRWYGPETLSHLTNKLELFKEQNKGDRKIECLIQHKLTELIQEKKLSIKLYPVSEPWIGVTNPGDEEKVKEFLTK